ncbi:zinc finger protein 431-like [Rhagoletis pomonella]|uniref:zinc finger protein 431-like n=1 Tax=Rhagoletis pomonella TaxID=28610 RepID=UPI001782CA24|nr:zinc finger protein 431-like [Rhagoletis pomonella]
MQCRACMDTDGEFTEMSLSTQGDGKTLYDYFNACTQLHATDGDNLPRSLCSRCVQDVQIFFNFRQKAHKSNDELKRLCTVHELKLEQIYNEQLEIAVEGSADPLAVVEFQDIQENVTELKPTFIFEPELDLPMDDIKFENLAVSSSEESNNIQIVSDIANRSQLIKETKAKARRRYKGPYQCEFCECSLKTRKEWKNHIFEAHKSEVICMECQKVYDLPRDLQRHKKLVHGTEPSIQCPWCKKPKHLLRCQIVQHFKLKHNNPYLKYFPRKRVMRSLQLYECNYCYQDFASMPELVEHIKNHTFDCPVCSVRFSKKTTCMAHIRRIHKYTADILKPSLGGTVEMEKPYKCTNCSAQFSFERNFHAHLKNEHHDQNKESENEGESPSDLKISSMRFKRGATKETTDKRGKYENRVNITTTSSNCGSSAKDSESDSDCSEQDAITKNKRTYLCSYCPRQLSSPRAVQTHEMTVHSSEASKNKEECPICHKKFYRAYIKNHMRTVHVTERKSVCDICGDSFKNNAQLCVHKLLHKKRNFPCTVCEKAFTSNSVLNIHMRSHTGETPYACHLCDRRFKIKIYLKYHLQQHAGFKRKCEECGEEFNHIGQLKVHMYKHKGMPYRCPVCDYATPRRIYFTKHLLSVHGMTMSEDELSDMFKEHTGRYPRVKNSAGLLMEEDNINEENVALNEY